jgi:hypothetical protein
MMRNFTIVGIWLIFLLFLGEACAQATIEDSANAFAGSTYYTPIIQDFRWVGFDSDMVGDGGEPDGIEDGHFQITLNLPEPMVITRMSLYRSNEAGDEAVQPYIWDTDSSTSWGFLGMFYNGSLINNQPELSRFSGQVQLDIYCKDIGVFVQGNYFGAQVYLQGTGVTVI